MKLSKRPLVFGGLGAAVAVLAVVLIVVLWSLNRGSTYTAENGQPLGGETVQTYLRAVDDEYGRKLIRSEAAGVYVYTRFYCNGNSNMYSNAGGLPLELLNIAENNVTQDVCDAIQS